MLKLVTRIELSKYVALNDNIKESAIEQHILDAQKFNLYPAFPDNMLHAIEANILAGIPQWMPNKAYSVNDKIVWSGIYYKALSVNTNSEPPSIKWGSLELMNFHSEFLIPFIAYHFYYRFVAYHGVNVTPFGLRTPVEETSQPIDNNTRGLILADMNNKINMQIALINKKLDDVKYTFDGVKYDTDKNETQHVKQKMRLWGVGNTHWEKHKYE